MSQRCPDCGQFMGDGHACPENSPLRRESGDASIRFERLEDGSYVATGEMHPDVGSLEDLLERVQADPDRFAVKRWVANRWPTSYQGPDGEPRQIENLQVKAWLVPKSSDDNPIPPPLELAVPEVPAFRLKRRGGSLTSVHASDAHFPYHDPRAANIYYQILRDVGPGLVVEHGDVVDCVEISKYEKDPHDRVSLAEEIQMGAQHLGTVHQLTPDADHLYLLGNHEDRLRRLIWKLADDRAAGEILTLPGVQDTLDWSNLLGVGDLGWEVVDYPEHRVLFDKLIVKHGNTVRKHSAYSARYEYETYGKSGMSGHTHRRGCYEHRDYNGFHAWWELGMLGSIRDDYTVHPDWQQGFAVVTWSEDRKQFGVEPVRIHDGVAYFRGKRYVGDSKLFGEVAA